MGGARARARKKKVPQKRRDFWNGGKWVTPSIVARAWVLWVILGDCTSLICQYLILADGPLQQHLPVFLAFLHLSNYICYGHLSTL